MQPFGRPCAQERPCSSGANLSSALLTSRSAPLPLPPSGEGGSSSGNWQCSCAQGLQLLGWGHSCLWGTAGLPFPKSDPALLCSPVVVVGGSGGWLLCWSGEQGHLLAMEGLHCSAQRGALVHLRGSRNLIASMRGKPHFRGPSLSSYSESNPAGIILMFAGGGDDTHLRAAHRRKCPKRLGPCVPAAGGQKRPQVGYRSS